MFLIIIVFDIYTACSYYGSQDKKGAFMLSYLVSLGIVRWFDVVELVFFSSIIYTFCLWLKRDRTRFLLGYFYAAGLLFVAAWFLDLYAVVKFYRYCWPVGTLLFIIIHQRRLQQSYVAARVVEPIGADVASDWLHVLMRAAFKALQRNKQLMFLLDGKQTVAESVTQPVVFNCPVQQILLDIIIESAYIEDQSLVLVNQRGKLVAINGQWRDVDDKNSAVVHHADDTQNILAWTQATDLIAFFVNPESKRVTVIAQATVVPDLTGEKAELVIGQIIRKQQGARPQKGVDRESFTQPLG